MTQQSGRNKFLHNSVSVCLWVIMIKIRAQVVFMAFRTTRFVLRYFVTTRIVDLTCRRGITLPQ